MKSDITMYLMKIVIYHNNGSVGLIVIKTKQKNLIKFN